MLKYFFSFLFITVTLLTFSQKYGKIYGVVKDDNGKPVEAANVAIRGLAGGTATNEKGFYELLVPADTLINVVFSFIGYETKDQFINIGTGERKKVDQTIKETSINIPSVTIFDETERSENITKIDPKLISEFTSPSGSFEAIIKTLPGVSSNNELSSQYSVRGGNYDENLIYVNDVEIYRPYLVRSGQQEGLSFINSEMVGDIKFSAGGFEAKYGDKLSSVLDITYKNPTEFGVSASGSLLGGALNVEGISKNKKFTYLVGLRRQSNQYILNSLNTQGDYKPVYADGQVYLNYALNQNTKLSLLGHYSLNRYNFIPETRETVFGTFNEVLRLLIFFEGQEINEFQTGTGALILTSRPNNKLQIKHILSAYSSVETETFDVEGSYIFDEIEGDFSKETFGQVKANRGIGRYLNHARNYLDVTVVNFSHKGDLFLGNNTLKWGAKVQQEFIKDELSEWTFVDSAGFSVPQGNPSTIELQQVNRTNANLNTHRFNAFVQDRYDFNEFVNITGGVRASYWDLNEELIISPRFTLAFKPDWEKDVLFRASYGKYAQPPFYRELRDFNGVLNTSLKAQKSTHYVLAADYNFRMLSGRPFKLVGEVYYKELTDIIPYEIDNVRIRYYANNSGVGYAKGVDLRLNGQFINDLESWFSVSVLETKEDIIGDEYFEYYDEDGERVNPFGTNSSSIVDTQRFEPGYIPRPTDQRVNVSVFFQDELPNNPSFKVHLNGVFGSGLPFGPPDFERFRDTLRIPSYKRVDIGFSKEFYGKDLKRSKSPLKNVKSVVIRAEIFNLLGISNTISHLWITDVNNTRYAVPNFLTSRRINLRLTIRI
ncbi:MAG: hypothetical protein ACJAZ3_001041 [Sphingobacteriales bacterium]|jgi:hypothetical protein